MSVIFPRWTNAIPTVFAIGSLVGLSGVVGGFWYYATPKFFKVGYMPHQPGGGFNHQIHAGKLGIDCRYCHTKVESSNEANIPNVSTCYGCHQPGALTQFGESESHKTKTEFVRAAWATDTSIEWRRVHKLPDYVRNFPHQVHIAKGVSCVSCHGMIPTLPEVFQAQPLSMSWCLDCHRKSNVNPELVLVPPSMVTRLQEAQDLLTRRANAGTTGPAVGAAKVNAPENCGACHY